VLLHVELVDGAELDRGKKYVDRLKPTTACTLRLVEYWQSSGRIVVADAWFGSVRTVEELLGIGLYSVVCVKQGCKGFPRDKLKALVKQRGDTAFFRSKVRFENRGKVQERPIFAGGHMDKQPLFLCASTGTSLLGEQKVRYRSKLVGGAGEGGVYPGAAADACTVQETLQRCRPLQQGVPATRYLD